jgi:hypothetical protein
MAGRLRPVRAPEATGTAAPGRARLRPRNARLVLPTQAAALLLDYLSEALRPAARLDCRRLPPPNAKRGTEAPRSALLVDR